MFISWSRSSIDPATHFSKFFRFGAMQWVGSMISERFQQNAPCFRRDFRFFCDRDDPGICQNCEKKVRIIIQVRCAFGIFYIHISKYETRSKLCSYIGSVDILSRIVFSLNIPKNIKGRTFFII